MKSRIKKLLAAALALCLIAAMVPGAALADSHSVSDGQALTEALSQDQNANVTINADITINNGFTVGSGQTVTVSNSHKLTIGNNAAVTVASGGKLVIAGTLEVSGKITGAVESSGEVTVNGTISGAVQASAKLNVNEGATVGNITSSSEVTVNGTAGNVSLTGGTLTVGNNGKVGNVTLSNNATTATINGTAEDITVNVGTVTVADVDDVGTIIVRQGSQLNVGSQAFVANSGAPISVTSGTVTIDNDVVTLDGVFTANNGLMNCGNIVLTEDSSLTLSNISSFEGTITVEEGATLTDGGTQRFGSNSLVINSGSVDFKKPSSSGIEVTIPSTATVTTGGDSNGEFEIGGSDVYNLSGTLNVTNRNLKVTGTVNFNGGDIMVGANKQITVDSNGSLLGNGDISLSGRMFYDPTSTDGGNLSTGVAITMLSGSYVYSKTGIDSNLRNWAVSSQTYNGYSNVREYGRGTSYNITWNVGTGGTIVGTPSSEAAEGSSVSFTVRPNEGYVVDRAYYTLQGAGSTDISVSNNVGTFFMPNNNITVTVTFKEGSNSSTTTEGNITITTNHNGHGTISTPTVNNRVVSFTVRADSNYVISSVRINGVPYSSGNGQDSYNYTYSVGSNVNTVSIDVTFESDEFTVTTTNSSSRDGDVYVGTSGYANSGEFQEGDRVYIRAVPDSRDYALRTLYVYNTTTRQYIDYYEASGYDDVYYFTMPESNVTVWGYFTDGIYDITTDIDGRGSLAIRDENGNTTDVAEEGEEIRIYPSANNGYRLGDLYVTYTDSDDEDQTIYPEAEYNSRDVLQYYWFEMPEYDVEIYADFGEGDYVAWIDRNNIEHGSIRVSPNVADEDDTVSVYVTPDSGYQLDELVVEDEDGRDVSTTALASGTRYTFRMPDSDVTISATFRSRNYTSNFTDVPRTEWYYEAVSYVATEGLMNGVSTTQFNPNGTASRAQIVTILWRLAGEPSALTGAFTDVPAGEYYSTAVAWASRQGIVTGVGNNRFEPNSNITREQLAVILYRYAQDAGYSTTASGSITGYYDYARVNGYARTALQWAVGTGLITGTSSTTLSPQDTATRAQVATILMRFCENIVR